MMLITDQRAKDVFIKIMSKYKERKSEEIIDSFFQPAESIESRKFTRNYQHLDNLEHERRKRKSYQWIKTPKFTSFHTHPQEYHGSRSPPNKNTKSNKHKYGSSTSYFFTRTSPTVTTITTSSSFSITESKTTNKFYLTATTKSSSKRQKNQ